MNPHMSQFRTDGLTIIDREGEGWGVTKEKGERVGWYQVSEWTSLSVLQGVLYLAGIIKQGVVLSMIA
ncbi:hypothetical protein H9L39_04894 [Fusarium oxysporum f. sp. albedinis]|nr:hypothetical protein H9L39_04894 [Fusarium oxysporum f. sp. albedinis]